MTAREGKLLFVGVRLSVAASNALAGCAETLARRARDAGVELRWVAPINYHVTLSYLGWTGVDAIGAVCDALATASAGFDRLTIRAARLGGFASLDRATALWAGIEDSSPLVRLAGSVADAMAQLGFRGETRPFHPHVTIARLRESRAIRDVVLPMSEQMFGDTKIDAITLFESETKSSSSVYRDVGKITFKRARNAPVEGEKRQTVALERDTPDRDASDETDDGWPRGQGPTD